MWQGERGRPCGDDGKKKGGIKTRGSDGAGGWKDNRHGHKKSNKTDDGQGLQAPTEPVARECISGNHLRFRSGHKMAVKATEVIKAMMKMGSMVTINQVLDQETAMIVVEEMGHRRLPPNWTIPMILEESAEHKDIPPNRGPGGYRDGSRRPRQDLLARLHPPCQGGGRRIWRHYPAHRCLPRRNRSRHDHLPDTPGHEAFTAMHARVPRPPTSSSWWWRPMTA